MQTVVIHSRHDSYRLRIKRKSTQKSDKIEQKTNETEGDSHLVQQRVNSKNFTKTGCNAKKYLISAFQNHLQTKTDLHISICQTKSKRNISRHVEHPVIGFKQHRNLPSGSKIRVNVRKGRTILAEIAVER